VLGRNFLSTHRPEAQNASIGGWKRAVMSALPSPCVNLRALILLCSVFVVDFSNELPEEMTSFVRLLMMSGPEWAKTKGKSKFPKAKVDDAVLSLAADVVRRRLGEYPTTIEGGFPEVILSNFYLHAVFSFSG